ncbi:MAG: methyltransferase domain-containing protein [Candidatus Heimdallarchaeota archaeon]|nr:methyltransferase domain-containing protein [Candidatus Heimdallarchaeota archaeon]
MNINNPNQSKNTKQRMPIAEVYDLIAESFDSKRSYPWKEVKKFTKTVEPTELVLDLGCGNGRHTQLLVEREAGAIGLDISYNILKTALENQLNEVKNQLLGMVNADIRALPFKDNQFDKVLMIAVLHHVKKGDARKKTLLELHRILKVGGEALVSCWQRTHPRFKKPDLREKIQQGKKDVIVAWTLPTGKKIPRYYYLFDPEELVTLVNTTHFKISEKYISNHNLFLKITK